MHRKVQMPHPRSSFFCKNPLVLRGRGIVGHAIDRCIIHRYIQLLHWFAYFTVALYLQAHSSLQIE